MSKQTCPGCGVEHDPMDWHDDLLHDEDKCVLEALQTARSKLEAVDLARSDDARAFEKRLEDAYARNRAVAAERDSYASRLDSIRAKCEAGASVSIPASYPYGDGYREACAHILAMVVERQEPGCDGKHGPPECNDTFCWRGPIMNA